MANVYNYLYQYADRLGYSFVLIHHASKGNQTGKSITDVGAGAGSQSRATDTHLILRPHEEKDCVVPEAAVRSWPPVEPRCLRWLFPVWTPDSSLDPTMLRRERRGKPKREYQEPKEPKEPDWTPEQFVEAFVSEEPKAKLLIVADAVNAGLFERKAVKLLRHAEALSRVHRWRIGANLPVCLAPLPQLIKQADDEEGGAHTHPPHPPVRA